MESSVSGPTRPCCLALGQVPRVGLWGEAVPLVRKTESGQLGRGVDTLTAGESDRNQFAAGPGSLLTPNWTKQEVTGVSTGLSHAGKQQQAQVVKGKWMFGNLNGGVGEMFARACMCVPCYYQ